VDPARKGRTICSSAGAYQLDGPKMDAGMYLALKYDKLTITLSVACEELGIAVGTAHNKISAGTFPIPTRIEGQEPRRRYPRSRRIY
jgi:hypothetical protein